MPRKRTIREVEDDAPQSQPQPPKEPSLLHRIRSMWQLANVVQFLAIFGPAAKIEAPDINDLEAECLKPHSLALQEIGLSMLKFLSSHRGLTHELFDEYTRRQFMSKAPELENPFGHEEIALKFSEFDVFKKIRVLHQMSQLMLRNPDKMRERMADMKDVEHDHTSWRIEPLGWDEDDRTYFLLDDNRLYRLTDAPPPPPPTPKPKKNSKKARAAARAAKRRRVSEAVDEPVEDEEAANDETLAEVEQAVAEKEDDGLGGARWECIAVSLDDVNGVIASFKKTQDPNEKILRKRIQDHLVPILEREAERRQKKEKEREKELLNLEKMANAKRSSRLAHKAEQHRVEEQTQADERKRMEEAFAARKEQEMQRKMEKDRNARLMSREKRLRERETRRLQHERELSHLSEDSKSVGSGAGRMSERRREAEIQRAKKALEEIDNEEEWTFDCVCGLHGQVDDGEHSVACERCNVWQHSKCLGIGQNEAESENFHFVCGPCRKREEDKDRLRVRGPVIKIKLGPASSSPAAAKANAAVTSSSPPQQTNGTVSGLVIELVDRTPKAADVSMMSVDSPVLPPPQETLNFSIPVKAANTATSQPLESRKLPKPTSNGVHNPFSSPHPELSPPSQSPTKARAYDTMFEQSSPLNGASINRAARESNGRVHVSTTPILPPTSLSASLDINRPVSPTKSNGGKSRSHRANSSTTLVTPQVKGMSSDGRSCQKPPPLPPSSAGVSPTKHSPSFPPVTASGIFPSSSPTPPVLPPIAALSPSPRAQDLTPPVKSTNVTPASSFQN